MSYMDPGREILHVVTVGGEKAYEGLSRKEAKAVFKGLAIMSTDPDETHPYSGKPVVWTEDGVVVDAVTIPREFRVTVQVRLHMEPDEPDPTSVIRQALADGTADLAVIDTKETT